VTAPGTDAGAIEISFTGADEVRLNESGDLILHTAAGDVIQHKPLAYQMERGERREVPAAFRWHRGRLGFVLGVYDRLRPLIIDPVIDYATWFPGKISNVIADASGSAYIAGQVWTAGRREIWWQGRAFCRFSRNRATLRNMRQSRCGPVLPSRHRLP